MKCGITDIARILGITTSAIRYFEKEHLINVGKEKNGHRYYNEEDVFRLLSYTKYRSMEIPMKQIVTQFSGEENNWKKICEREIEARNAALEKARHYQELAANIKEHIKSIQLIERLNGRYEFDKSPGIIFAQDDIGGWLPKERDRQDMVKQWVKNMPEVCLAVRRSSDESSGFGYIIDADSPLKEQLPMGLKVLRLNAASCLHTIVKAEDDFAFHPQKCFNGAYEYAKGRNFQVCGQPWGKILLVEVERGQHLHTYVELWMPIC